MRRETTDLRGNDIIDSRDVKARIADLERYRDEALGRLSEIKEEISRATDDDIPDLESQIWTAADGTEYGETNDWGEDTAEEFAALQALESECDYGDWEYGAALIRDSYFEEYAQQLAEDIGAINKNANWPNNCIDWGKAADELKQDYTLVDFDGTDYWIRS